MNAALIFRNAVVLTLLLVTMRLYFTTVAALSALVTGCPLPANSSHSPTIDVAVRQDGGHRGWTEVVSDPTSSNKPWPRAADGLTRILYCYPDADHKRFARSLVQDAIKLWMDALGSPSKGSGHSIVIEEHSASFCMLPRDPENPQAPWLWDPSVPEDTLVIQVFNSLNDQATAGYSDGSLQTHASDPLWGRHSLHIGMASIGMPGKVAAVAHEFGKLDLMTSTPLLMQGRC